MNDTNECIPRGCFELNLTSLPTDKCQLTKEHDQVQNNILEVHSHVRHSSYTNEFNVKTYVVDYVKYMLFSLHSEFPKDLVNLYIKHKTLQCQHIQQNNKN